MSDNRSKKVISGDELTAYERWELPLVGEKSADAQPDNEDDIPIVSEQVDDFPSADDATQSADSLEDEAFALPSAEEIESIREAAYQEGFEQGYSDGTKKGDDVAQQKVRQLEQQCRQMLTLLRSLKKPLEQVDEQVEKELVALALKVAQHVVYRHIEQDPNEIIEVVQDALQYLPSNRRNVELMLNPVDIDIIQQHLPGLGEDAGCKISADPQQRPGGCRVKTDVSQVDVRLENRIATVFNRISGASDDITDTLDVNATTPE